MNNAKDITEDFGEFYFPASALVFYQNKARETDVYVEHFDMDSNGNPINAHPLTVQEADVLAKALQTDKAKRLSKTQGDFAHHHPAYQPRGQSHRAIAHQKTAQTTVFCRQSRHTQRKSTSSPNAVVSE